jgi:hypothetical protein
MGLAGLWAASVAGLVWSPAALFYFFVFSPFSFSVSFLKQKHLNSN